MRLTIRNLLAYLDDTLEPADAQELEQKIAESEFASGLVHRIRSVPRKLRLGAPKVSGKGMGLDANTVAEYLDFTLPPDRVPDFEKICLESDVHLAEVASCHQIVTLVLGEPADVDPVLRERIQALGAQAGSMEDAADEEMVPRATADEPTPPPIPTEPGQRDESDIPDVVTTDKRKEKSFRLVPLLATIAITFLLAVVAIFALGPLDENHPVIGRFLADASSADSDAARPGDATDTVDPGAAATKQPVSKEPVPEDKVVAGKDGRDALPGQAAAPDALPAKLPGGPEKVPEKEMPSNETDDNSSPTPDPKNGAPAGDLRNPAPDVNVAARPGVGPPAAVKTKYMSDQHILARFDSEANQWQRLPAHATLVAGQRLIAVAPTYRPQIVLPEGIHLVAVGPAEISILELDADGIPGVAVEYGRVFCVFVDGEDSARLNVQVGDRRSQVTLHNLDSTLALEVRHYLPPGSDPERDKTFQIIDVYAIGGRLSWTDDIDAINLDLGQAGQMVDLNPFVARSQPATPAWLESGNMRLIDRDASEQLEPLLVTDQPLVESLRGQVTNRLVEVRSLAINSLSLLDEYEPFVNALNDGNLRSYWRSLVESLRAAMARNPQSATLVRTALQRLRGEEGSQQYRMLWGFSPEQIQQGEAGNLVELLESGSMDIRVLAFESLYQITQKTNNYHPEQDPKGAKGAILKWRKDWKEGEIVYKTPPKGLIQGPLPPSGSDPAVPDPAPSSKEPNLR